MSRTNKIQVFEHKVLKIGHRYNDIRFENRHFDALAKLNQYHDNRYFTLLHKAIKFSEYVGVIQVDDLVIEILPKVDNTGGKEGLWQKVLIDMLKATKKLKVQNVGEAKISKQNIHLLDIYFEWYLNEIQDLIRKGLIKKYYLNTENVKALKGKLEFAGHIQQNLIHKERFYTSHQIYDKDHLIHQILNRALSIIENLSKGDYLYSKCKTVQLDFPETSYLTCSAQTFQKIKFNRKNAPYRTAIEIARIIILNYAPNVTSGSEQLLALLFDMNRLWEDYVLIQLKKKLSDSIYQVFGQNTKPFINSNYLKPDIVIQNIHDASDVYIIDTKWKVPGKSTAKNEDLRQLYTYGRFWKAKKVLLLYPGDIKKGMYEFFLTDDYIRLSGSDTAEYSFLEIKHQCKMGSVSIIDENNLGLDQNIGEKILEILELPVS
ncbi:McrC family protein [Constantimarinum furrinae]|uniref:5-Methylcytosine-specific restriction enzyme C n=1 Tax=Constantimarinum furrinae TaxID=2562285 RepID=A0A7G8PRR6_9FLAO|nr:restriction endonuclease [Constantimarinum furrinae]QNJ97032.1 5-Methylcytosine-specific restriction enzyme C [Constantimarinum furrinae]